MAKDVEVRWSPDMPEKLFHTTGVKDGLTKEAAGIAQRANMMAAGFTSGIRHDPKTGQRQGGTQAVYRAKKARETGHSAVAIAYTGNYASQKHNAQTNALAKSI